MNGSSYGRLTALGVVTGMVAGLGSVTPASGFVELNSVLVDGPRIGLLVTVVWTTVTTRVILKRVHLVLPLRVDEDDESMGLARIFRE